MHWERLIQLQEHQSNLPSEDYNIEASDYIQSSGDMDPASVLEAARESGEAGETGESGSGEVDSELYNISVAEPAP
jgi:hypothetical protein